MRRVTVLLLVLVASLLAPTVALAKGPVANCPSSQSGYYEADKVLWWMNTVAGFEDENIPVYDEDWNQTDGWDTGFTGDFNDFAVLAGFGSAKGLYEFVWVTQWDAIDKNGDGVVCMKNRPHTPGNPAYFFNGVDNTAH